MRPVGGLQSVAPRARRARGICPECGAAVSLVRDRWLQVHREGSAEYPYPSGRLGLCVGSLLPVAEPANHGGSMG